ncbi:LptE family protein [Chondrinema litorale]|uniref:LptE family protein n=1 Tax=Chondrinema litorale TaxID=2994555 RepID=UPI0025430B0C|nr:LptE family protein [Chondrinema litorale]UZR94460.1 LptE family protein [Chondrinema litorale]
MYIRHLLIITCLCFAMAGCRQAPRLTFTGATIPEGASSFSVANFMNDASDGPADLGIRFTEELRDYFQRNTSLEQVIGAGDLQFSGSITRYDLSPVSAGATETQGAQLQRLTIAVKYDYIVLPDDEKSIENGSASQFSDFSASQNLADVEDELIDEIFEQIIFDIFNRTLADW